MLLVRADTISTNATLDDLPGPGRGLDKLYQRVGRRIELTANLYADRLGFGPSAVERSILAAFEQMSNASSHASKPWQTPASRRSLTAQIKKSNKDAHRQFGRLIKHMMYVRRLLSLFFKLLFIFKLTRLQWIVLLPRQVAYSLEPGSCSNGLGWYQKEESHLCRRTIRHERRCARSRSGDTQSYTISR